MYDIKIKAAASWLSCSSCTDKVLSTHFDNIVVFCCVIVCSFFSSNNYGDDF